eukprot:GHVU01089442.1.p1 GENE.GHVU01089442.1~~GHVU01089442.1.p1  ORF type:complete len:560 (+),score=111.49 GHVU01089442.1:818-2497(+)
MGSEEGFTMADKAIQQASRQGTWVLLKNVHLSCKWLNELEKKMYKMVPNEKFRIFLTMEFNPKVPKNLLRLAYTFVFEPPAGIKASVLRSFSSIMTTKRSEQNPMAVRCRMHFLLAFLHAVVLERKRYVPVGWSKGYEFSDADQQAAIDIIDQWIDQTEVSPGGAKGRDVQHLDPARIPWEAIRTLLQDVAYGGRLDNEVDKRVLFSIIESIFTPNSFDSDFELSLSYKSLNLPDLEDDAPQLLAPDLGRGRDHYIGWVESALPLIDKPTWLGFAPHAELLLSQRAGSHALTGWGTLHGKSSEDLHDLLKGAGVEIKRSASLAAPSGGRQAGGGPKKVTSWIDELLVVVETLLKLVTVSFQPLPRTEKAVQDPLFRCFDREVSTGSTFVMRMKADLELLKLVCAGEEKFTNYTRDVAKVIFRGGCRRVGRGTCPWSRSPSRNGPQTSSPACSSSPPSPRSSGATAWCRSRGRWSRPRSCPPSWPATRPPRAPSGSAACPSPPPTSPPPSRPSPSASPGRSTTSASTSESAAPRRTTRASSCAASPSRAPAGTRKRRPSA